MESCCTCATLLSPPLPGRRRLACCGRIICGECIQSNRRFATYCPYCQVSTSPSPLPQRLKDPPSYTSLPSTRDTAADTPGPPPPYTPAAAAPPHETQGDKAPHAAGRHLDEPVAQDALHFLDHDHDSIASLSLRYGVPATALRRANNITSDHLLLGRKTILIPGEYYRAGISLSPRPVQGEEEELRKSKIRRFMTSCKVSDYDVALLYLEQSVYDLGASVEAYRDDVAWEESHPMQRLAGGGLAKKSPRNRGPFWRRI